MSKIITHPGSAHLDDFLSICLVIEKYGNIDEINRREPTEEEIKDPSIWKLDVGEKNDPNIRCYDHHQGLRYDCTLSLLLKEWKLWKKAKRVHEWLSIVVANDAIGPKEVTKILKVSFTALIRLDSFVERTILDLFKREKVIKKEDMLFSLMKSIGQNFFTYIGGYYTSLKEVEKNAEYKKIKGVQIIKCIDNVEHSSMLVRILNEKKRKKWENQRGGIAIYPNKRVPGTIALRRYEDDKRVDFSRISNYDKVVFAHPKGFFISLEPMPDSELDRYIGDAIKKKEKR